MEWDSIFNFSTFKVKQVSMPKEPGRPIRVHLIKKDGSQSLCYKCGHQLKRIHSFSRCVSDDLPILEHKVVLHYRRLKGRCNHCKKTRMEAIEFISQSNPKMTHRLAYMLYKFCEIAPVSRMAETLDRDKMSLWRNDLLLLRNQMAHYEIPEVTHISVDEVYAKSHHDKGENHFDRFFTIIVDLNTRKVIWIEKSRRKEALDNFFTKIGKNRCCLIEAVATDEHQEYINSVAEYCPNAIHILDRFHLMMHFEKAVNDTRKMLFKMLPQGSVRKLAKGSFRYIFLKRDENRTDDEKTHMKKVMKDNEAFTSLEIIKERMITFFDADDLDEATKIFLEIENWAFESGFPPIKKYCLKLRKKWEYISNYFMCKISTGVSEGINNTIKALKRRAFGFKNMEYFRLKIMQVAGLMSSRYMDLNGDWTPEGALLLSIRNH